MYIILLNQTTKIAQCLEEIQYLPFNSFIFSFLETLPESYSSTSKVGSLSGNI